AVFAIDRPVIEKKAIENACRVIIHNAKKDAAAMKEYEKKGRSSSPPLPSPTVRNDVEFIRPKSDENQRLVNQSGLFSRAPDGINLDDWELKNFEGDSKYYTLRKLLIPNSDRTLVLRTLNRMNINHLSLFPDLYGASKYCNLYGEIKKY
ncbi:MAG: hypothetical protein ACE5FH_09710, partial [Candidatus Zixiibacteriota bacterium]